jgi:hypothetical protein
MRMLSPPNARLRLRTYELPLKKKGILENL